jgi:hypothetical protein
MRARIGGVRAPGSNQKNTRFRCSLELHGYSGLAAFSCGSDSTTAAKACMADCDVRERGPMLEPLCDEAYFRRSGRGACDDRSRLD